MKKLIVIFLISAAITVQANECSISYDKKINQITQSNPVNEAEQSYCNGEIKFKAMSGIEHLVLEVPERLLKENTTIEHVFYLDGILCNKHKKYLELQEKHVRSYNIQMVKCIESDKSCCSK